MIIGMDIGISNTKLVALADGCLLEQKVLVQTDENSYDTALAQFLAQSGRAATEIQQVMLTGVGASFLRQPTVPAAKLTDEFQALGLGGVYLAGLEQALVVSMGTGTAMVKVAGAEIVHIGGSGIGGGTLMGLAGHLLQSRDFQELMRVAAQGDLAQVDLLIGDVSKNPLPGLPSYATAANLAKAQPQSTKADLVRGIVNMVYQAVGRYAVFAAQQSGIRDVVLVGTLAGAPFCHETLSLMGELFAVNFLFPPFPAFATAIGAALAAQI